MKSIEFVKKHLTLSGWKTYEAAALFVILVLIFINAIRLHDNPIAVCSAVCGILYTTIAGKGKISCYFFGLMGSWCYIWLAFSNALWGNMLLYLCYYIPMQILGIFRWKKHFKQNSKEIVKTKLPINETIKLCLVSFAGCIATILLLAYFNDKSPVIDGITTFLSIVGMYLTVRRCIEQWIVWMIVNGLSLIMWINIVMHGTRAYSTVIMWAVYFVLAFYFYFTWKKEISE